SGSALASPRDARKTIRSRAHTGARASPNTRTRLMRGARTVKTCHCRPVGLPLARPGTDVEEVRPQARFGPVVVEVRRDLFALHHGGRAAPAVQHEGELGTVGEQDADQVAGPHPRTVDAA